MQTLLPLHFSLLDPVRLGVVPLAAGVVFCLGSILQPIFLRYSVGFSRGLIRPFFSEGTAIACPRAGRPRGSKGFGSARSGDKISTAAAGLPAFTRVMRATSPSTAPKKNAQNKARVTQKVMVKRQPARGALFCKAGHSPPATTARDRECPSYPLCSGAPRTS